MPDVTVGALAARTGLTVRTLHHYDAIGLLSPSGRTEAGYRLYSDDDIRRLQHIVLLRGIGLPLSSVAAALSSGGEDLLLLLEQHAGEMRSRVDDALRLLERIEHMTERLRSHTHQSIEDALETIQAVNMFERYFDRDQMDDIREHAQNIGDARIREAEAEWPRLIAAVRHEMHSGTDPGDPRVAPLARRWQELIDEFTNGRFDIAAGVGRMMHAEPTVRQRTGLDAEIMDYVARATARLR
jgi:DNA-binding transcriptional MerR regulator